MSWKILRSSGECYYLLPTSVCKVGRQGCEVIIADTTVSRHHADISVNAVSISLAHPTPQSVIRLRDVSKYVQTTVNGTLLTASQREITLQDGDQLLFGACPDVFSLKWDPIVFRLSRLLSDPVIAESARDAGIVLLCDSIDVSIPLLIDELYLDDEDSLLNIADGGIFVKPEYISIILQIRSGVPSIPTLSEYELQYPCYKQSRRTLLEGHKFVTQASLNSSSAERLVRYTGGIVVQASREKVIKTAFVIGDKSGENLNIANTRYVLTSDIAKAIFDGSTQVLLEKQIIVSSAIEGKPTRGIRESEWINVSNLRKDEAKVYDTIRVSSSTPLVSVKNFKKSRIATDPSESIPLKSWNTEKSVETSRNRIKLVNYLESDMDSWLDSYNSQI